MTAAGRTFKRVGSAKKPGSAPSATPPGVFDLTPTEDEQMLVDVVGEFAEEMVRPVAAQADEDCAAPDELLKASLEIGLPILGVPESLGGISEHRSAMAGTLVAEALAKGDMGLAVSALAPGGRHRPVALGHRAAAEDVPARVHGRRRPGSGAGTQRADRALRRAGADHDRRQDGDELVLDGVKSLVPRGADAELFVVGAQLDGQPALVLVESGPTAWRSRPTRPWASAPPH